jgi:hypothetical protein
MPAILQTAAPPPRGSPPIPTRPRPPPVTCANALATASAVTRRRPRPFRPVPRGQASGGAKVERNPRTWVPGAPVGEDLCRAHCQGAATGRDTELRPGRGDHQLRRRGLDHLAIRGGGGLRCRPSRPRPGCPRQPLTSANAPSTAGSHAAAQPSATSSQGGSASASNRSLREQPRRPYTALTVRDGARGGAPSARPIGSEGGRRRRVQFALGGGVEQHWVVDHRVDAATDLLDGAEHRLVELGGP